MTQPIFIPNVSNARCMYKRLHAILGFMGKTYGQIYIHTLPTFI